MGTDISIFAEKRIGDEWRPAPEPTKGRKGDLQPTPAFPDVGRPYALFSFLSGAEVGLASKMTIMPTGFGGRGFPSDLCSFYKKTVARYYRGFPEGGDWGASWLMLSEFKAYDWNQRVTLFGFVDPEDAWMFDDDQPFPDLYPKEKKITHNIFRKAPETKTKVYWSVTLREYIGCYDWFVGGLEKLAGSDDLRIIYSFDS